MIHLWKLEKRGGLMANPKVTVSLSPKGIAVLEKLVEETGLKKAAVVQLALEKYAREVAREKAE
jgi:hypothetical protein